MEAAWILVMMFLGGILIVAILIAVIAVVALNRAPVSDIPTVLDRLAVLIVSTARWLPHQRRNTDEKEQP